MPSPPPPVAPVSLTNVTLDYTNLSDTWFQFFEFQIWSKDNTNVLSGLSPTLFPTQHGPLYLATKSIINQNSRPSINTSYVNQNGQKKGVYNLSNVNLEDLACCVIFARNNEEQRLHNVIVRFDASDGTSRSITLTSIKNNWNYQVHKIKFGTQYTIQPNNPAKELPTYIKLKPGLGRSVKVSTGKAKRKARTPDRPGRLSEEYTGLTISAITGGVHLAG